MVVELSLTFALGLSSQSLFCFEASPSTSAIGALTGVGDNGQERTLSVRPLSPPEVPPATRGLRDIAARSAEPSWVSPDLAAALERNLAERAAADASLLGFTKGLLVDGYRDLIVVGEWAPPLSRARSTRSTVVRSAFAGKSERADERGLRGWCDDLVLLLLLINATGTLALWKSLTALE
ncbi:MAG: hypothetical protein KDE27_24775 [Planctomycetes bacterium]|nr:hypothetical protein [Planctomycetota bacterium]